MLLIFLNYGITALGTLILRFLHIFSIFTSTLYMTTTFFCLSAFIPSAPKQRVSCPFLILNGISEELIQLLLSVSFFYSCHPATFQQGNLFAFQLVLMSSTFRAASVRGFNGVVKSITHLSPISSEQIIS